MFTALRHFFQLQRQPRPMTSESHGAGPATTQAGHHSLRRSGYTDEEKAFTDKYLEDLHPTLPVDRRIAAAYALSKELHLHAVDSILQIWPVAEDLTTEHASIEARRAGFALLKAFASHSGNLQERVMLFHAIIVPVRPSEASLQISALDRLTRQGTDIGPFGTELIAFLTGALDSFFWSAQDARKLHSSSSVDKPRPSNSQTKGSTSRSGTGDDLSRDQREEAGHSRIGEEKSLIGAFYLIEDILTHNSEYYEGAEIEILVDRMTSIAKQTSSRKILHGVVKILRTLTSLVRIPLPSVIPCLSVISVIYKIPKINFEDELSTSLSNLLLAEGRVGEIAPILIGTVPVSRPGDTAVESHPLIKELTKSIFDGSLKSDKSHNVVIQALSHFFKEFRMNAADKRVFESCLQDVCAQLSRCKETPILVLNSLADLAAQCGPDITNKTFDVLMELVAARSRSLYIETAADDMVADQTVDCLIRLFLRCHPESALKTKTVFELLIMAAGPSKPTIARLSVMKLLTRLRCNSEQAVEVVLVPDSLGLAGILCRTEATDISHKSAHTESNRESIQGQSQGSRQGRSSKVDVSKTIRSRSATRSSNLKDHILRPTPPLWIYNEWTKALPEHPRKGPSQVVYCSLADDDHATVLNLAPWLEIVIDILKDGSNWELYSYVLVHLPSQLSNRSLFSRFVGQIQVLQNLLVEQLEKASFSKPPHHTKMTAGDVALCLYHILTVLLAYHEHFGRRELDNLVRTFSSGINKWDRAGRCCIHALVLCCHEIPSVIDRHIFAITQKLSQKMTQSDLAVDILEFLGSLARLPEACSNATARLPDTRSNTMVDEASFFKTIFGTCIGYIRTTREQRLKHGVDPPSQVTLQSPRQSTSIGEVAALPESRREFPEYVYALAYQVIIFWFLAVEVGQRAQHVGWIAKELAWKDALGKEHLEEQSQVILDMMHRTAFSDLGETEPAADLDEKQMSKQLWLLGMSLVTVTVSPNGDLCQITKRQASGTTHAMYRQNTARLPEHHIATHKGRETQNLGTLPSVFPNHILLQLTSTIAPIPIPLQPIKLSDDDFVQRWLRNFDRTDTVDGHKVGVIYVAKSQSSETEILANTQGSKTYNNFLSGLGTRVKLQGAQFNTQGLDRESDLDGTYTYAWRDRVTEMVFHVTTMMPTDILNDPQGNNKKRHIGNDRVKIIFNDSGKPFVFETFPSEMNEVNIVVTPEAFNASFDDNTGHGASACADTTPIPSSVLKYYKVETLCSPKVPRLSAAAIPKVVSADALPGFVRQLALSASVFSQVWSELLGQGEYVSSWRWRLKEIKKLREKYGNTHASANVAYPMPADSEVPTYVEGNEWNGTVTLGGMAEPNQLLTGLDFTRWG
ncbi:Tuberous sclerosis 2-like protein [Lecanora helva]